MRISDLSSDVCAASAGWLDQDRLTRRCRALPRSRSCSDCISKRWRLSVKNGGEAKDLMLDFEAACDAHIRSEEHTSELQSLMRNSYAVFCLKKKSMNTQAKD